ncbi:MAG: hypothetical protein MHM6MM_004641 [Cercozoa sp. M6MM]
MERLYQAHKDKGFTILAFPCNQFLSQEPWAEDKIKEFAREKMGYTGPMFSKIEINGENTHPIYQWLKEIFPGDITWNFASKFLIDRNGVPVRRFDKSESWESIEESIVQLCEAEVEETGSAAAI